jgi:hypothetical protein
MAGIIKLQSSGPLSTPFDLPGPAMSPIKSFQPNPYQTSGPAMSPIKSFQPNPYQTSGPFSPLVSAGVGGGIQGAGPGGGGGGSNYSPSTPTPGSSNAGVVGGGSGIDYAAQARAAQLADQARAAQQLAAQQAQEAAAQAQAATEQQHIITAEGGVKAGYGENQVEYIGNAMVPGTGLTANEYAKQVRAGLVSSGQVAQDVVNRTTITENVQYSQAKSVPQTPNAVANITPAQVQNIGNASVQPVPGGNSIGNYVFKIIHDIEKNIGIDIPTPNQAFNQLFRGAAPGSIQELEKVTPLDALAALPVYLPQEFIGKVLSPSVQSVATKAGLPSFKQTIPEITVPQRVTSTDLLVYKNLPKITLTEGIGKPMEPVQAQQAEFKVAKSDFEIFGPATLAGIVGLAANIGIATEIPVGLLSSGTLSAGISGISNPDATLSQKINALGEIATGAIIAKGYLTEPVITLDAKPQTNFYSADAIKTFLTNEGQKELNYFVLRGETPAYTGGVNTRIGRLFFSDTPIVIQGPNRLCSTFRSIFNSGRKVN